MRVKHLSLFGSTQRLRGLVIALIAALLFAGFSTSSAAATTQIQSSPVMVSTAAKNCSATSSASARPTVHLGDTGSCVRVVQQRLLDKGYNLGVAKPTGNFQSRTKAAVVSFQKKHRLVQDGVVGPITWKALIGGAKSPSTSKPAKPSPVSSSTSPVILTYDDCPASRSSSNAVFKAAHDMNVHLRLYVTGNCLKAGRFDVAYARAMGHTVCNHSNTHPNLTLLSLAGIRKELTTAGLTTNCGRPPYGATNAKVRQVFKEKGLRLDMWNVDTNDWRGKSRAQIVSHAVTTSRPGDVVLMHFHTPAFSAQAIKEIKSGLQKRGLSVQ